MTKINDGGPAFPITEQDTTCSVSPGLSLRDYFAAKAMQALIMTGSTVSKNTPEGILTLPARVGIPPLAYEYADAMLAARGAQ
ncbi:hypothetical protein LWS69_02215 [Bordetella hinzii]|nr:hypothetical protein [Bordetella hinzii]